MNAESDRCEHSAGAVLIRAREGMYEVLAIRTGPNGFELPKGDIEPGETAPEAAIRELREETGLLSGIISVGSFRSSEYAFEDSGVIVHKRVEYFLFGADGGPEKFRPLPKSTREIRWIAEQDIEAVPFRYEDIAAILKDAIGRFETKNDVGAAAPSLPDDHERRIERAKLSLEGLSLGDAYGNTASMFPAAQIEKMRWSYTDDTAMAMAIVRVLRRRGRIEQDELADEFAGDFMAEPNRGYGGSAQALLRSIASGHPWRAAASNSFGGAGSMGNGGAMRVAPIGAYFADDLERAAREARASAEITHAHAEAQAGAVAVAIAAAAAVRIGIDPALDPWIMVDLALESIAPCETREKLAQARRIPLDERISNAARVLGAGESLLSQDTVPFTLWMAARHACDFRSAIECTAMAGGDMDTNCAIVGGIVALSAGSGQLPMEWQRAREFLKG